MSAILILISSALYSSLTRRLSSAFVPEIDVGNADADFVLSVDFDWLFRKEVNGRQICY